jgi:hypothetical protein
VHNGLVRITVTRSGGFAAIRKQAVVDSDELPSREQELLSRLVADARSHPAHSTGSADAFVYTVRIDEDGGSERVVLDDASMPTAWRRLVEWVLAS